MIFFSCKFLSARKLFAFTAALFVVCLFGQTLCRAQSGGQSKVSYAEPSRLMLKGDENEGKEASNGMLLREKFYPIGWSKDGKFAYYVEPPDEGCDCYFADLVIQDLRTDKILWQRSYDSENGGADTIKKYWAKNRREFSRKLAQYGIRAQKRFALTDSAIAYKTDVLTPEIKVGVTVDNDEKVTGDVVLRLISNEKGSKTIYKKKFDPKKYDAFRDAEISGSLPSPFEPRAAVIMIETYRGWEGLPQITSIRIVGTSLTNGFTKDGK